MLPKNKTKQMTMTTTTTTTTTPYHYEALGQIESWANSKDLSIAPNKSSITLFTPDPAQGKFHPQVLYKGNVIPLNKCPKILVLLGTHNSPFLTTSTMLWQGPLADCKF
jgi:hypothetical protein